MVTQWEEDHERHFVVFDTRFLDLMEEQIEERSQKKETEKMKKVLKSLAKNKVARACHQMEEVTKS